MRKASLGLKASTLHLHITTRCPYRCPHCTVNAGLQNRTPELNLVDLKKLINQSASLEVQRLDISGGDPLIREKNLILEVLRYASQNNLETSISTNGFFLTKEYVTQLKAVGLRRIKFSLYGTDYRSNDSFTGVSGSFQKTLEGIQFSKEAVLEVWVNAVFMPQNLDQMLHLPKLLDPMQVDLVQLSSVVPSGRGQDSGIYTFSDHDLPEVINLVQKNIFAPEFKKPSGVYYVFTNTIFPNPKNPPIEGRYCNNVVERLVIDSEGNVIPCCLLPERLRRPIGNIREADLYEIYCYEKVKRSPIFAALLEGHEKLAKRLGYEARLHNLCSACADMLRQII